MSDTPTTPPGWYYAEGDAPGTKRYWDGSTWVGEPQLMMSAPPPPVGGASEADSSGVAGLSSVGKRMGGRLIDAIIGFVLFGIPTLLYVFSQIDFQEIFDQIEANETIDAESIESSFTISPWLTFGLPLLGFLWDWLWVSLKGATPGKLMVGTRIVRLDGDRGPLGFNYGFRRTCNRLLAVIPGLATFLPPLIGLASLIMLFAQDQRRTVMDMIAGTVVVDK